LVDLLFKRLFVETFDVDTVGEVLFLRKELLAHLVEIVKLVVHLIGGVPLEESQVLA
jgi:hypothetical protein